MAILRAALLASALAALAALAACGGDGGGTPDAAVVLPDTAPPDTAPPDTTPPPTYDLSCATAPFPTTAPATITAAGTVQELGQGGAAPVGAATIATFQVGTANALDTATSAADGSFTTGGLPTGGVPFDGYFHAAKADAGNPFRDTVVFPPAPLAADAPVVPILMFRAATFSAIAQFVYQVNQDDTDNGALMILVTDCASMPMAGVTPTVTQGGASVGSIHPLTEVSPMAVGIYLVFNVPAGDTDVSASYMGTSFPVHRVISFPNGNGVANGATTLTIVRPGPL
jgi:hypothetical protein